MTTDRAFLIAALARVVDGGDIENEELDATIPDPRALPKDERSAWAELSHWADDDDIRAKDKRYAASKRGRMRDCLAALKASNT